MVLDSEQLSFKVTAQDDYGVKRVGMEWRGIDKTNFKNPAAGERILAAGGPDKELLELTGTFSAVSLGIEPQPIHVRLFAEDYFPGRQRVYSPTYLLYVLTAEQHAIWLTEQLSKWHRQSLDVRDREMQLFETNKQLRQLSADEINQPDTRRRIENQADAERANGRRLSNLVAGGEELVKQAMRNPEFGVGHLEKWAEMLQILKDISANRMPSVADLLKQASQAPHLAMNAPKNKAPMAGQVRTSAPGKPPDGSKKSARAERYSGNCRRRVVAAAARSQGQGAIADRQEWIAAPRAADHDAGRGAGKGSDSCPAGQKMDEAVAKQQDLLAEFEQDRRRAQSRARQSRREHACQAPEGRIAASIPRRRAAGRPGERRLRRAGRRRPRKTQRKLFEELSSQEAQSSQDLSNIMDDMQSYFERRRFVQFKTVLDDMVRQDAIGSLRQLGDDLQKENGLSMAQCEYWSDTLDRWAEDLVEPTSGGT